MDHQRGKAAVNNMSAYRRPAITWSISPNMYKHRCSSRSSALYGHRLLCLQQQLVPFSLCSNVKAALLQICLYSCWQLALQIALLCVRQYTSGFSIRRFSRDSDIDRARHLPVNTSPSLELSLSPRAGLQTLWTDTTSASDSPLERCRLLKTCLLAPGHLPLHI